MSDKIEQWKKKVGYTTVHQDDGFYYTTSTPSEDELPGEEMSCYDCDGYVAIRCDTEGGRLYLDQSTFRRSREEVAEYIYREKELHPDVAERNFLVAIQTVWIHWVMPHMAALEATDCEVG